MTALNSAAPVEPGSADGSLMPAANASRNFRSTDYVRAEHDWYVEPRWCVEQLADTINFGGNAIWDPCAGGGTIPSVFFDRGARVFASDVVERSPWIAGLHDATFPCPPIWLPTEGRISVVTNPPFRLAEAITRSMLALADHRVCILQQLSFLASAARHRLFTEFPPSDILILSKRPSMPPGTMIAEMGDKAFRSGTTDFCWIVWTKPHDRETRTRWLSPVIAS
jgi:hypothetical protein